MAIQNGRRFAKGTDGEDAVAPFFSFVHRPG